jgi:hypothetical protein
MPSVLAEATATFPALCHLQRELLHQRLTQQQEKAARLAALTLLPLFPVLSQEACDEALTISLALGTSSLGCQQ